MSGPSGPVTIEQVGDVPEGTVLDLRAGDWQYGENPLLLRVVRVRQDLAGHYGGLKVWVDGYQLDPKGHPIGPHQALVTAQALRDRQVRVPPGEPSDHPR